MDHNELNPMIEEIMELKKSNMKINGHNVRIQFGANNHTIVTVDNVRYLSNPKEDPFADGTFENPVWRQYFYAENIDNAEHEKILLTWKQIAESDNDDFSNVCDWDRPIDIEFIW